MITKRGLNRATLDRQLLLRRSDLSVTDVVQHLVGLQAQAPDPPYFGLWSRLQRFSPADLSERLLDRQVVRAVLMRGTIHLVTAEDAAILRALVQPVLDRDLRLNTTYAPGLAGMDLEELRDVATRWLTEAPRTLPQLKALVAERWPDRDPATLVHAIRGVVPTVQTPPRGVWGSGGQPTLAATRAWVRRIASESPPVDDLVLRYLRAFGPATVADMQVWSGLPRLTEVFERMRPDLHEVRDEHGAPLFDLPDAPRPHEDTPAPVRLLAPFDNLLLSHANRARVVSDEHRRRLMTSNGLVRGTLLLDGFVQGIWGIKRSRKAATVTVTPYSPLTDQDMDDVTAEALRLLDFAAPTAGQRDVRIERSDS